MDAHHKLLWLFLYLLPWLIFGYGLTSLWRRLSALGIAGSLTLVSVALLVSLGPQPLFWYAIWVTLLISFGTFAAMLAKGNASRRARWLYGISLITLNVWLYVDPLRLMDWFYD